ncbi:MAG: hypothetical protein ACRD0K_11585, partial [Egibacteraceae bacterium]
MAVIAVRRVQPQPSVGLAGQPPLPFMRILKPLPAGRSLAVRRVQLPPSVGLSAQPPLPFMRILKPLPA